MARLDDEINALRESGREIIEGSGFYAKDCLVDVGNAIIEIANIFEELKNRFAALSE